MNRFITAIASRKSADTVVPMMPPTSWMDARLVLKAIAVAAMAIDASTTTVECLEREEEAGGDRFLPALHELSRNVVDRRDMVGVDRVTEPQSIRQKRRPDEQRIVAEGDERPGPLAHVSHAHQREKTDDLAANVGRVVVQESREAVHARKVSREPLKT